MRDAIDITFIIDRSGSMAGIKNDVIGGFNSFIQEQLKTEGEVAVSFVQFDDQYEQVFTERPIKEVSSLTSETFVPRGTTALLDAIGRTIVSTGNRLSSMAESRRPDKVVMVIITDGEENASREFAPATIHQMIYEQRNKYNWQFVFIGADQDCFTVAKRYGISSGMTMNFAKNSVGTHAAFTSVSGHLKSYRAGTKSDMSFEDSDYKAQEAAGADNSHNSIQ